LPEVASTTVAPGFSDLKFRFLYVGAADVQWDDSFGLGLTYMHARHYSTALGRFLQPDPARAESNLYAYAGNNPITRLDPSGEEQLNAQEWAMCWRYPWTCHVWLVTSFQAFFYSNLVSSDVRVRNAIRHCMWQCLLTSRLSWKWAQAWGLWHEYRSTDLDDTHVDYHNNYVGRLLGTHMNELFHPFDVFKARELCVGAWNWGYLWYQNSDGSFYTSNGVRLSRQRVYASGPNTP